MNEEHKSLHSINNGSVMSLIEHETTLESDIRSRIFHVPVHAFGTASKTNHREEKTLPSDANDN